MGKVCAVKNCFSGSAADQKRRKKLNLKNLAFFRVPKSPTQRQQWIKSLSQELNDRQYVCELHFQENDVQHFYLTKLPNGEINKIEKGKITRAPNSVPRILNQRQSPTINDCHDLNETTKLKQEQHEQNHQQQQQQKEEQFDKVTRSKLPNGEVNKIANGQIRRAPNFVPRIVKKGQSPIIKNCYVLLEKTNLKQEQHEQNQQQRQEKQFNKDDMETQNLEKSYSCNKNDEQLDSSVVQSRLSVKRKAYPEENVTLKRVKYSEDDINCNSQINLNDNAEILRIIVELNKSFPVGWSFFPGVKQLTAIQFDRYKLKERVRLVISEDRSVLVTFVEHVKKKLNVQINSVDDIINCLKSLERKNLCSGTGFDKKSFSIKCHGDVTDYYKRYKPCPRCPECRKLRSNLLKTEKYRKRNTENKIETNSKATNLEFCEKTKQIQHQLQVLRSIQRSSKTIFEDQFNKKISLLPKQQQITVRMCFENSTKKCSTGKRYEIEWIYECLLIRMKSTSTYNMIRARNIIPLPTTDILSRCIEKIRSSIFGFLPEKFEVLKQKALSMAPEDRKGQISADEVKLTENIEYNKEIAEYTGFVNLEKYTSAFDSDVAEDHALVFMFVPYRGDSAQPLGCFITKNSMTSVVLDKLFLECIILVENAGFQVNSIVTDAAQWNKSVWTNLGVDHNNISDNSCEHPCDPNRRLWVISDFPYLANRFKNGLVELDEFETPVGMSCQPRTESLEKIDPLSENAVTIDDIRLNNSSNDASDGIVSEKDLHDSSNASEISLDPSTPESTSKTVRAEEALKDHDYDVVSTSSELIWLDTP